ncbi:MAG: hypothetical protein JO034_09275 [Singulisphaera sp.]|nr:hypothetical protein [Singulisphaera sp.]
MAKTRAERAGPKAGAKPKGKGGGRTGRPVKAEGPKHNALSIRGAMGGRDWLTRLSDHCRPKTADVIDPAVLHGVRGTPRR